MDAFRRTHLGRAPFASPGTATGAIPLLSRPVLERVLASEPPPDALVVGRGRMLPTAPPRSLALLEDLLARGLGVVVRRAERHEPGLAALAASFAGDLPGEVHLQLFVTPGGTHGFGWHYDAEDVFIVQTEGRKDYFFRRNTIDPTPARTAQPDFSAIRRETTPTLQCTLIAGDWLYLPSGWWHVARCVETSLSISLGVFPASPAGPEGRSRESS